MSAGTLISLEEYLHTSYSPEREYRDGVLVERNVGDNAHAKLMGLLTTYMNRRRKAWKILAYLELRVKMRENWYPVPDVCVYPEPIPTERYPSQPPLLWIEIVSQDDRLVDLWEKAAELVKCGVPYVWIIEPNTLKSELHTADGILAVPDQTLRLADSPIVIPLVEVVEE